MANRVDTTRQDHRRLRQHLDSVIAQFPAGADTVAGIRDQVVALLTGLVRHRQAGADMVYEAYNVDVEAAD